MKRHVLSLLVIAFAMRAAPLFAGAATSFSGPTMGTTYEVKFGDSPHPPYKRVERRLQEINARMSTYIEDSEVSRFNRAAADKWFPVSNETAALVKRAQEISRETDGAFDITVGPLIRLWNFGAGADDAKFALPTDDELESVRQLIGYTKLEVRDEPPALRKSVAGLEIDLSAIAKGYAVDEIARILDDAGTPDYMVEIGGEIRVRGVNTGMPGLGIPGGDGSPWRIGIEAPSSGGRRLYKIFFIGKNKMSLATSGDYRNFYDIDGKRYSHTIDPQTARPVEHKLASATVNTPDCLSADAYATALMVMGPTRASNWAEQHQIGALMLVRDGDGVVEIRTSHFQLQSPQQKSTADSLSYRGAAVATLLVFSLALFGMAIGVIISKRRLKGSCGGLAGFTDAKGNSICDACTDPSPECRGVESRAETRSR